MPQTYITLLLTILTISLAGCQPKSLTAIDRSLQEYGDGQWLLSKMWAEESIGNHANVDEANYMIGLCEFQRNRLNSAKQWFEKSSQSQNREVRSKSNAMLGIIAESNGDPQAASIAFAAAANELVGRDKQRALSKTSPNTPQTAHAPSGYFTLQFGAYRDANNAKQSVDTLNTNDKNIGLGNAWIKEENDSIGRKMYLVQAGKFVSRTSANSRKNIGDLPKCIIVRVR